MPIPIHISDSKRQIRLLIGDRKLVMHRGDVTELTADALVCPVDQNLDFRSGVARVISLAAGRVVRSERPVIPEPFGKIVVLPGGHLNIKYIFLSVILGERDQTKMKHYISQAVERTIRYAEFLRLQTIAFPVLGSPKSAAPYNFIAREMMENVVQYLRRRHTKLNAVLFSVYNREAFEAFRREARFISNL